MTFEEYCGRQGVVASSVSDMWIRHRFLAEPNAKVRRMLLAELLKRGENDSEQHRLERAIEYYRDRLATVDPKWRGVYQGKVNELEEELAALNLEAESSTPQPTPQTMADYAMLDSRRKTAQEDASRPANSPFEWL